ncbi:MAG: fatty-acid--CoA ligase [Campylobacter sp.]
MSTQILIIVSLVLLFLIILAIVVVLALIPNNKARTVKKIDQNKPKQEITLQDLLNMASDRKADKNDLFVALKIFSNSFKIPPKNGGKATLEAKEHLRFVSLLASHPRADAKLIAFMNSELIKRNPEYAQEIDMYEKTGMSRRH